MNINRKKKKAIFIVGPTSSGKTSLAADIAKKYNGEIISADSRQVYVGMDIGTGKEGTCHLKRSERSHEILQPVSRGLQDDSNSRLQYIKRQARWIDGIPQYLIDIVKPGGEKYNLAKFLSDAKLILEDIWQRGKLPIVTGGTGLYISALLEGYSLPPINQSQAGETGRGMWHKKIKLNFNPLVLALDMSRPKLYKKIDKRLRYRMELGLIGEVRGLIAGGVDPRWLIKIGLEYRYVTWYLLSKPSLNLPLTNGEKPGVANIPLDKGEPEGVKVMAIQSDQDLYDKLRFAIHAYARRQLTWIRHKINRPHFIGTTRGRGEQSRSEKEAYNKIKQFLLKSEQGR